MAKVQREKLDAALSKLIALCESPDPLHLLSIDCYQNARDSIVFWATRVRAHLAAGLGKTPAYPIDRGTMMWKYDVDEVCGLPGASCIPTPA